MTTRRSILIFWTLILVPALIMAGAAFTLLRHEEERLSASMADALGDQARTLAQTLELTVTTVQDNLTQSLIAMIENEIHDPGIDSPYIHLVLEEKLTAWEKTNPLVRNVFVFSPRKGLIYPQRSLAATAEERAFIRRFQALFTGRVPFNPEESDPEPARRSKANNRNSLYGLSRAPSPLMERGGPEMVDGFGWIPWFSQNRLHILGWVQGRYNGVVFGMELEVMTLVSRLITDFPQMNQADTALALSNGTPEFIHQTGNLDIGPEQTPRLRIPVSSALPHWEIQVFVPAQGLDTGRSFFILSMGLTALLLVSMISGGFFITRLTLAKARDASQKTSFVASVSHELKTPLTSIRMYAELLLSGRIRDKAKTERYLGIMVAESLRLTRLINTVLDFGRLEQGRKTYSKTEFELTAFLQEILETHRLRIQKSGLEVITRFPVEPVRIYTDRDAIEQVVLNLIDNALKYADGGEKLTLSLEQDKADIYLSVQDQGPGIAPVFRDKIFEKFYRMDTELTAARSGSGLGLPIARQMARDLGGDLYLEPGADSGACFTLRMTSHDSH